ncbi:MAG: proline--tRNA ligase [bacterium]
MKKLADINKDFAQWYQDVIYEAELVDSSPVKGSMVIRPYGYSIWENMQKIVDQKIKQTGTQNAYFPLFIPESFLKKEAEHIEGFSPELAVVTYAGGKNLEEPLVVRPTSETIIYSMFAKWITSWRDLPLKINQWANVVRWELRPRAFIRTTEFLWQEGHTAHATKEEATKMALEALELYKDFMQNYLAIPVIAAEKSAGERFAGAAHTYSTESLMQDGKALQMGTTHVLLHSFPESFDIKFQDKDGELKVPYCSSWGVTTRMIGGLIMTHGDQNGLIIPPKIAPIQVVIIPIYKTETDKNLIFSKVEELENQLKAKNIKVIIDNDEQITPGAKFYKWEIRGIPLRIELGPKDLQNNHVILVDRLEKNKQKVSFDQLTETVLKNLDSLQAKLFERAQKRLKEKWYQGNKLKEFGPKLEKEAGLYQTGWCGSSECEKMFKDYKATIRCVLEENKHSECAVCGKKSGKDILVAKAY